jgi:hypothetical protein
LDGRARLAFPYEARHAIEALASGWLSEISIPHTGPLDVTRREELSRRLGSVFRLDKHGGSTERPTWTLSVAHPRRVSTDDVLTELVRLYPHRIRGTNLRTNGTVQFNSARQAFLNGERERRSRKEPASNRFRKGEFNYVDIGPGDSWDAFAGRLNSYGLLLIDPQ